MTAALSSHITVFLLRYAALIKKGFLLSESPTAFIFHSLAHHLFEQYQSYGPYYVFTVGPLCRAIGWFPCPNPLEYFRETSMIVQEKFDQYFEAGHLNANTLVLPNLPEDLN